ncbi:Crp/Fnr family transcriptional regulator [Clostridium sp. Marseille-P299]|uniref:Crp/Fnr family transcriptional regulator n=1 Tax=Clostridium sp. Marseille-P299 TaxID=1805477 RepID=UPI0009EE9578|nr:Crp/Fnr family transcriptional regulator [Clostridium sp. Marseille-P299]
MERNLGGWRIIHAYYQFESEEIHIDIEGYLNDILPIWNQLSDKEQETLSHELKEETFEKGKMLHRGFMDCTGLYIIKEGQLRIYMISEQGKEITLYRLFERDICLLSASCIFNNIQFEVHIEAEKDTKTYVIPTAVYKKLLNESVTISNFTNQLITSRFSDVMWLMEQILFRNFDNRLALFIIEQSRIEESDTIRITHEEIAKHLGSAREVVSRMLKYFQSENMISLFRGGIKIEDYKKLETLIEGR